MVEEATTSWSHELQKINRNLTEASNEIQSAFANFSSSSSSSSKDNNNKLHSTTTRQQQVLISPDADPVNILKRIALLESTLVRLNSECDDYVRRRPALAQEVTSLLIENFRDIEEVSDECFTCNMLLQGDGMDGNI